MWSYNLATAELTRILTTPYGAETTSVYAYPDVNGHGYVMAWSSTPTASPTRTSCSAPDQAQAYLGYIGPFPKLD